jgi:hypothetical protein
MIADDYPGHATATEPFVDVLEAQQNTAGEGPSLLPRGPGPRKELVDSEG